MPLILLHSGFSVLNLPIGVAGGFERETVANALLIHSFPRLRQFFYRVEYLADLAGLRESLVGGQGGRDETRGEHVVHLLGPDFAAAVEGEVPGDADEPWSDLDDVAEFPLAFEHAEEDVLDYIFSFGCIAENGQRDPIEQA
jgi:hypothetical protein